MKSTEKKSLKYKCKVIHIIYENEDTCLVSFNKKGTKKFSIKKDKDGKIQL